MTSEYALLILKKHLNYKNEPSAYLNSSQQELRYSYITNLIQAWELHLNLEHTQSDDSLVEISSSNFIYHLEKELIFQAEYISSVNKNTHP